MKDEAKKKRKRIIYRGNDLLEGIIYLDSYFLLLSIHPSSLIPAKEVK
jgi:hypothetical protein